MYVAIGSLGSHGRLYTINSMQTKFSYKISYNIRLQPYSIK